MLEISAFLFNTNMDLHESPSYDNSVAETLSRIGGDRT